MQVGDRRRIPSKLLCADPESIYTCCVSDIMVDAVRSFLNYVALGHEFLLLLMRINWICCSVCIVHIDTKYSLAYSSRPGAHNWSASSSECCKKKFVFASDSNEANIKSLSLRGTLTHYHGLQEYRARSEIIDTCPARSVQTRLQQLRWVTKFVNRAVRYEVLLSTKLCGLKLDEY